MRGEAKGVGRMSGDAGGLRECEVKTPITAPSRCATPDRVNPELVGLSRTPREGFG